MEGALNSERAERQEDDKGKELTLGGMDPWSFRYVDDPAKKKKSINI